MNKKTIIGGLLVGGVIAGCATISDTQVSERALEIMRASFKDRGQAKLDRLNQDEVQSACSRSNTDGPLPKSAAEKIENSQLAKIKYPADGNLLGDWKEGEKIAQSGVGKQFSDDPLKPAGGNCYACHQMSKKEIAFGTIGPSLYNFGKVRGNSAELQKYTYGKVYNPDAYAACTNMPRFGHNGILTEKQIKDVVALLLDPQSPVNE